MKHVSSKKFATTSLQDSISTRRDCSGIGAYTSRTRIHRMKRAGEGPDHAQLLAWIETLSEEKEELTDGLRSSRNEVQYLKGNHKLR